MSALMRARKSQTTAELDSLVCFVSCYQLAASNVQTPCARLLQGRSRAGRHAYYLFLQTPGCQQPEDIVRTRVARPQLSWTARTMRCWSTRCAAGGPRRRCRRRMPGSPPSLPRTQARCFSYKVCCALTHSACRGAQGTAGCLRPLLLASRARPPAQSAR